MSDSAARRRALLALLPRVFSAQPEQGALAGVLAAMAAALAELDPIYVVFNVSERRYLDYRLGSVAADGDRQRPAYVPPAALAQTVAGRKVTVRFPVKAPIDP
jgi:hypothetical protein